MLGKISGLNHDQVLDEWSLEQKLHASVDRLVEHLDPDPLAGSEKRDGAGFLDEPLRIGGKLIAGDTHELEGVREIGHHARQDGATALVDETGVRPMHENDLQRLRQPPKKAFRFGRLDRDHLNRGREGLFRCAS